MRVLFLVSGVYPHYMGGVSTWADLLVNGLSEHEFHIVSVVSNPHVEVRYKLPKNVKQLITIPLCGTERPEEYLPGSPISTVSKALHTTEGAIRRDFIGHFEEFFDQVKLAAPKPDGLAEAMYGMHVFLRDHDFRLAMHSRSLWDSYAALLQADPMLSTLSLYEAINILRTIGRYLFALNIRPPETDLAHSAIASIAGIVGAMAHMEYGTPNILTEHGIYVRERMLDLINQPLSFPVKVFWDNFHSALAKLNYHFAERIYPVCTFNSRWERQFGIPHDKVHVVYNGVDGFNFAPMEVPRPHEGPTVVAVIRIDRLKDAMNLIQAMGHVHRNIPEAKCLIYGPSPDADYARLCVKEVERLHLQDVIEFKGFTRDPEVAYNTGDVAVMSSVSEGFPFALIEGMACGKATVATDVGGIAEALGGSGLLVPPRQPKMLGKAIVKLLRDKGLREELGGRARDRALSYYGIQGFIDEYRTIYAAYGGTA